MPIKVRFNGQNLGNFIAKLGGTLIILFFFGCGLTSMFLGLRSGSPGSAVFGFVVAVACFMVVAILFYYIYTQHWIESGFNRLFGIGPKIKEVPVPINRLEGLITNRKIDEARAEIEKILPKCRKNAHFVLIVMDFYLNITRTPEEAWELGVNYIRSEAKVTPVYTTDIVLRLCDIAGEIGRRDEAIRILRGEIKSRRYAANERHALERRLAALEGR